MEYLFVINPTAGGGRSKSIIPIIERQMYQRNIDYKIVITENPREATKIAEENADKFSVIVAVGGDGTVNEVAKGIINKRQGVLGVIPCGTGNDFSKGIDLPLNTKEALETIIRGHKKRIDLGKINGYSFLNIASIGFDAEVVISTNKIKKKIKSSISYILGVLVTLFRFRSKETALIIDGEEYKRKLLLLAVGNGKCYGGGLEILPMAKMDDGYFHICLVKDISNLKLLMLFPSIFKGKHLEYKNYVEIYRAKEVILKNNENINLNIDGEIMPINKDIVFEIDDFKLEVIS